jgi:hypothetical protein
MWKQETEGGGRSGRWHNSTIWGMPKIGCRCHFFHSFGGWTKKGRGGQKTMMMLGLLGMRMEMGLKLKILFKKINLSKITLKLPKIL